VSKTAKEILLFVAGLCITVGLIIMAFDIFRSTKRVGDNINLAVSNNAQKMQEEHITKYSNSFISGAMVVSYVQEIYEDVETIRITPLSGYTYNAKTITEDILYRDMKTISNSCYINPLKNFYVTMERNANGIITIVNITEQME